MTTLRRKASCSVTPPTCEIGDSRAFDAHDSYRPRDSWTSFHHHSRIYKACLQSHELITKYIRVYTRRARSRACPLPNMYKTPSQRGSATPRQPYNTPSKGPGLYEDGKWLCTSLESVYEVPLHTLTMLTLLLVVETGECTPRKPAIHLQVRKDSANHGRFFYKCDQSRCKFFLWADDAEKRERDALMRNNCLSENGIVTRVQARGEPPATPSFPRSSSLSQDSAAPKSAPQQRIFTGRAVSSRAMSQDSFVYNSDEDDDELHSLLDGGGDASMQLHREHAAQVVPGSSDPGSSSQTLGLNSSSGYRGYSQSSSVNNNNNNKYQALATPSSAKRKRGPFLDTDSDEEFGGGADLDDDPELAALVDDSAKKHQQSVQRRLFFDKTPRDNRHNGAGGIPTPVSRNSLLLAKEAEASRSTVATNNNKRARFASPVFDEEDEEEDSKAHIRLLPNDDDENTSNLQTPTPYRKTNAYNMPDLAPTTPSTAHVLNKTPTSSGSGAVTDSPKIANEVLALLERQPLAEAVRTKIQTALARHELRVRGVVRGRDVARLALAERDERVAALQARVVHLQNARRMEKNRMKELSDGLIQLSQEADD